MYNTQNFMTMRTKLLIAILMILSMIACDKQTPQKSEYDMYIDSIVAQSQNFGAEDVAKSLPGTYMRDSLFEYNDDWEKIEGVMLYKGELYSTGLGDLEYTFTADGRGESYSLNPSNGPGEDVFVRVFDWHFDAENRMLVLSNSDGYIAKYKLVGLNNEYIVLDGHRFSNCNTREVFKRKVE